MRFAMQLFEGKNIALLLPKKIVVYSKYKAINTLSYQFIVRLKVIKNAIEIFF